MLLMNFVDILEELQRQFRQHKAEYNHENQDEEEHNQPQSQPQQNFLF